MSEVDYLGIATEVLRLIAPPRRSNEQIAAEVIGDMTARVASYHQTLAEMGEHAANVDLELSAREKDKVVALWGVFVPHMKALRDAGGPDDFQALFAALGDDDWRHLQRILDGDF